MFYVCVELFSNLHFIMQPCVVKLQIILNLELTVSVDQKLF